LIVRLLEFDYIVSDYKWLAIITTYFIFETLLYLLAIILLADRYKPVSFGRSFILLVINYIEINISFAIIYTAIGGIQNAKNSFDALYFSFVSFTTLGYGQMFPDVWHSKAMVIIQLLIMLLFVFLFFINLSPELKKSKG